MKILILTGLLALAGCGTTLETTIEVEAGKHDRRSTLIVSELPSALQDAEHLSLANADTDQSVEVQRYGDRIAWILDAPLDTGQKRSYRLRAASEPPEPNVTAADDGKTVTIRVGDKPVLVYNQATIESPPGIESHFRRSGHIHPLYSPSGLEVTDDFPPDHAHQHALYFAWVNSTFEGREVDFWNQAKEQGEVRHSALRSASSGSVFAELVTDLLHVDRTAPDGEKPVLTETWTVRVYNLDEHFLVDIESAQRTAGSSPLLMNQYRYGGMAARGAREWYGQEGADFLTSEGKLREEGNHTRPVWVETYGTIGGKPAGFTMMGSTENFRYPQPVRLHDSKPYFCFAPMVAGEFSINPGEVYRSAYRIHVHDGAPDAAENDRAWLDYSEPPAVRITR